MAATYTLPGVLLSGLHSARPAASAVASGTLYAETDTGQTYQGDGVSTWTAWGAVAGGSGTTVAFVTRNTNASSSIDYTIGNSLAAVDATNLTVTIGAIAGDVIGVQLNFMWSGTNTVYGIATAATIVGGSPVNYIDTGTGTPGANGADGWSINAVTDQSGPVGGEFLYTLQAGDISSSTVTVRPYAAGNTTGRTWFCRTGYPVQFSVKNYGH